MRIRNKRYASISLAALALLAVLISFANSLAQAPLAEPQDLGLLLPVGQPARVVKDRHVLLPSDDEASADPQVGKVLLEVGDRFVVKLTNGALRSVTQQSCTDTDRPFEPDADELARELRRQFPGFHVRSTRRYLWVYNTSDDFRERMTTILETMYPMVEKYFQRQRFDVQTPETPLVVVMFRSKAEFLKYRKMPAGLLAYYNAVDNRIFLYQHSDTAVNAPLIAAKQTISTIAHEGVHQILHNIGVQQRLSRWPLWIGEGLAEYFAPTTTGVRSKWKGVGNPNDLRMRELFQFLKERPGIGKGLLLEHLITSKRFNSTQYAIAWSLTHYLATKHRKEFFAYLHEISELAPLAGVGDERERFIRHFGDNFGRLERELVKHIRGLPYSDPIINQPYYLVTAASPNRRFATITSSRNFEQVKRSLLQKMSGQERIRAHFAVRSFPNRRQAEQAMALYTRSR